MTLILVALWWLGVRLFHVESYVLPTPFEALEAMFRYRDALLHHGFATLSTTLVGFAFAVVFGLLLGILVGSFRLVYSALYPILIAFNSVPKAALVPILVIWFGAGTVPAVATAFMLSFFPVVVNVATGFATIEPELLDVLRSLGASRRDMMMKIGLPRSLPYFFASLKIAITLAFVGSVIAEIVAGNAGIGNVMLVASSSFNVPLVFAALIVVGIMGVGMYAIFAVLETRFISWSVRGAGGIERMGGG
jgi:NitT/TauT family transport system permease protein